MAMDVPDASCLPVYRFVRIDFQFQQIVVDNMSKIGYVKRPACGNICRNKYLKFFTPNLLITVSRCDGKIAMERVYVIAVLHE